MVKSGCCMMKTRPGGPKSFEKAVNALERLVEPGNCWRWLKMS